MKRFFLFFLIGFLITFLILTITFIIYSEGFQAFIHAWWTDGTDTHYILSLWGWTSVIILSLTFTIGFACEYLNYRYYSIFLSFLAGVFFNFILTGIYSKAIW